MELSRRDAEAVLSAEPASKKVRQMCFEGGAELEAIANAALDSLAKDGIGCTSQLEHAMGKAATGICRRPLSAILQSEAARAEYTPRPGERSAGNKGIEIVSMFGPVGTVSRTHYYDRESRRGRYPRDERMGLVGRYTPALVEEVARAAEGGPYRKAAKEKFRYYCRRIKAGKVESVIRSADSACPKSK